jgi:soluble cytochrome b562
LPWPSRMEAFGSASKVSLLHLRPTSPVGLPFIPTRSYKGQHEMTLESVGGIFAAVGAIGSMLFGGNLFKRHIEHSNELAVTKYRLNETQKKLEDVVKDVAELKSDSVELHTKMNQFSEHIKMLELIPRLDERLDAMKELVENVKSTVNQIAKERR